MANPLGEDQKYMIGLFVEKMKSDPDHHQLGIAAKFYRTLREPYWSVTENRIIPAQVIGRIKLLSMYDQLDKKDPDIRFGNSRFGGDEFDFHWQGVVSPSAMQSVRDRANEANEILKELGVFDAELLGEPDDCDIGYLLVGSQ